MNGVPRRALSGAGGAHSGDGFGARAPSVICRVLPSFPPLRGHKARSPVGSSWGSGARRAEPSAGPRGLRTLRGSGSFVPRAGGARHAARWRGFRGPGRGRAFPVPPPPPEEPRNRRRGHHSRPPPLDGTPASRRAPGPASQGAPGGGFSLPAPGPSVPELAGSSACAFGLLADSIWRFCTLQGRLLRPRRFCLRGSRWGTPRAEAELQLIGVLEKGAPRAFRCLLPGSRPPRPFSLRPLPAVKPSRAACVVGGAGLGGEV